jgi:hypothetical protein
MIEARLVARRLVPIGFGSIAQGGILIDDGCHLWQKKPRVAVKAGDGRLLTGSIKYFVQPQEES